MPIMDMENEESDDDFFNNIETPGVLPSKTPTQRLSWMPKTSSKTPVSTVVSPHFFGSVKR